VTKYILNGGGIRNVSDEGKALSTEMLKGLGDKPKVLLCFFAQPEELWQEKYDEWTRRIAACVPEVAPEFGMSTVRDFDEQSKQFDALFVYGGETEPLVDRLKQAGDIKELLARFKVVNGLSAGAIMLSACSWSCDTRKVAEGQGIVPVKTLVHYMSKTYGMDDPRRPIDWQKAYDELAQYGDATLPIYKLHEGESAIFEL
jgi:hypothetical protein